MGGVWVSDQRSVAEPRLSAPGGCNGPGKEASQPPPAGTGPPGRFTVLSAGASGPAGKDSVIAQPLVGIAFASRAREGPSIRGGTKFFGVLLRVLGAGMLMYASARYGEAAAVALVYPELREPYRTVFQNLVDGIQAELGPRLRAYPLSDGPASTDLRVWLERERPGAIIALGKGGLDAITQVDTRIPVVAGAALLTPGTKEPIRAGVSLAADPDELFARLKTLVPEVKRVFVVYNPQHNAWLIRLASQAAARYAIRLISYAVTDLRSAVMRYREVLDTADGPTDAVWLPLDATTVDDRVVLPLVLESAWDKRFAVFSSNPAHAQRGALFSVYPDNVALGKRLAQMALSLEKGDPGRSASVVPLRDLRLAVNLRTADHLGIQFSAAKQRQFGLVFPSP
jgi:putative ABC transport system substrate-binding protein